MAFTKTGAPEKGVRIADDGWADEDRVPYGDDGFVDEQETDEEEDEESAAGEK